MLDVSRGYIMTQTAIEAKSLASLITLAANPPLRPQNGVRLDPLVLYIARVPGSRGTLDLKLSRFMVLRDD
jgi:hypothetical protein